MFAPCWMVESQLGGEQEDTRTGGMSSGAKQALTRQRGAFWCNKDVMDQEKLTERCPPRNGPMGESMTIKIPQKRMARLVVGLCVKHTTTFTCALQQCSSSRTSRFRNSKLHPSSSSFIVEWTIDPLVQTSKTYT